MPVAGIRFHPVLNKSFGRIGTFSGVPEMDPMAYRKRVATTAKAVQSRIKAKQNAPVSPGRFSRKGVGTLRALRAELDIIALGVPLVDDVVDRLDVALGVELQLADHGVPGAGLDGFHHLLRVGAAGL